jgi:GST-like protein
VHFQRAAPEKLPYAINRYRREAERHYAVLEKHLAGRDFIVGDDYSIADISAWGWIDRANFVLPGSDDPLAPFPNIKRWFQAIDARPAVVRAQAVGKDHTFKREADEETRRNMYPSNYPLAAN